MKKITIIFIVMALSAICNAQDLEIPYGKTPIIDGILTSGEWDDADYRLIEVQEGWELKVLYKHTDTALYFAFNDLKTMFGERYPDIMLDLNNDKDTSWNSNDWWFHASYNDCEGKGVYNNWQSCIPDHPGWKANNFPLTEPGFIEMEISYSKLGITGSSNDTFGIALEVSNTFDDYDYYPFNADISDPSSWTTAILSNATAINQFKKHDNSLKIYPNPAGNYTIVSYINPKCEKHTLTVYNSSGQISQIIKNDNSSIINLDISTWAKGLYFLKMEFRNGENTTGKLLITDQ